MPRRNYPVWRRYMTVELVIFFYAYGFVAGYFLIQQYVYSVVSEEKGFPYKELVMGEDGPGCRENITGSVNSTLKQLEEEVQSLATKIDLGITFFRAIPALFVAPFWGPWTDKSGRRKPALIAPIIGALLECTVTLIVMYFKLPLYTLFVGSAISGFSGFLTTIAIAVMSYIADTTEKTGRAFRIAIMQMLVFMGGVVSQLTSGLWIENFGFITLTWVALACYVASGLWAIFLVPENKQRVKHAKNKFFDVKNVKTLINVFKQPRPEGARKCLLFLVIAGTIVALSIEGLHGVTTLFVMRSPLCFDPKLVGYFLAYVMSIAGIGGAIGVKLFGNFFSEKITAAIGLISQIVEMAVLAFANRTWLVFLAPALGFFGGSVDPLIIGIVSRLVGVDEQGSLFCAVGILNVFSQILGAMIFNNVYEATLGLEFNGFVFLLSAALKLIPLGILSCIHFSSPTEQRVETDEEMRLENDKENGTGQDDALIKKGNDDKDNENGNDETALEPLAIPEDNGGACKDDEKLEQCNKEL